MTTRGTPQGVMSGPGQTQRDRSPKELDVRFVEVDDHSPADRLRVARTLAQRVNFYSESSAQADGDWTPFFADATTDDALAHTAGGKEPHLALFMTFLQLHEHSRALVNEVTARHLDFYYKRVLRFEARGRVPDRAHVVVELKKGSAAVSVPTSHLLSAGKDATGVELLYRPVRETVVGPWRVDRLHTICVEDSGLHCAPVANSLDGRGAALPAEAPWWPPFGGALRAALPRGQVGFALSSPVLRASGGKRTVSVIFSLDTAPAPDSGAAGLTGEVDAFLTGEKGWLGPFGPEFQLDGSTLRVTLRLKETDAAVADYAAAKHGATYITGAPVLQFLVKAGDGSAYRSLRGLVARNASIEVTVENVSPTSVENDLGTVDPKKVFPPFGPQPTKGARLLVGAAEALSSPLTSLEVHVRWRALPNFGTQYNGYGDGEATSGRFPATFSASDGAGTGWTLQSPSLFNPPGQESVFRLTSGAALLPDRGIIRFLHARRWSGSSKVRRLADAEAAISRTVANAQDRTPGGPNGFVTIELQKGFLHDVYRRKSLEYLMALAKDAIKDGKPVNPQEPFTPAIETITLSYSARSREVDLASTTEAAFGAADDVHFYHVDCFGERREHGYLRAQAGAVSRGGVTLAPEHEHGELLIGVAGLAAGDAISLLVEVLEGSADPELKWPSVTWSVLCDNHWKALGDEGLVLDTTRELRTSGVVTIVVPREATADNTFMPAGRAWLRASVDHDGGRVSRLLCVTANAVELRFEDRKNDPGHFATATPQGSISRWKTPIAAVKSVVQPYASFGAEPEESPEAMRVRAAERLRHKGRCISQWDYERVVLGAFPSIHRVKCIPHAKDGVWLAPGHVLVVVVPDLRNTNALNLLEPKVDVGTLERVREALIPRVGMRVEVHVKNPTYQPIRLNFKVKFRRGYAFNTYKSLLDSALRDLLCPWAVDVTREISFGGAMYRSVLLDFVEERPYVDFVTDFQMLFSGSGATESDVTEARVDRPDAILVSAPSHGISEEPT